MQDPTDLYLAVGSIAVITAGCVCILFRVVTVTFSVLDDDYIDIEASSEQR